MKSLIKYITTVVVLLGVLISIQMNTANAEQPPKPTLSVGSVEVLRGEEINVKIDVSSNPGIAFALIEVEYSEELDLINVWDGGLWGLPVFENDLNANPIHLLWDHSEDGDNELDGTLATLQFALKDDADVGEYWVKISYDEENIFNSDLQNVSFDTVDAQIVITDPIAPEKFPWIIIAIIAAVIAVAVVVMILLKKNKNKA